MSDLIRRADAIEAVYKLLWDEPPYSDSEALCREYAKKIVDALPSADITETETCQKCQETTERILNNQGERIKALEASADAVQGWIPCSERLPKVGENVLFTTDIYGGYVAEGDRRADGKWWQYRWNALLQNDEVTAWMPLPKPYKGGDSE